MSFAKLEKEKFEQIEADELNTDLSFTFQVSVQLHALTCNCMDIPRSR